MLQQKQKRKKCNQFKLEYQLKEYKLIITIKESEGQANKQTISVTPEMKSVCETETSFKRITNEIASRQPEEQIIAC